MTNWDFLKMIGWIFLIGLTPIALIIIYYWIRDGKDLFKRKKESHEQERKRIDRNQAIIGRIGFIAIILFLSFLLWKIVLQNYIGYEEIDVWFEKNNYQTQYYVYLRPENAESKNYRVLGDINHSDGRYWLEKVYWPNGGESYFDDCDLINDAYCLPNNSNDYYYVKLDEKVK